jgi:membrane-associated phospholipid phosphatase
MGRVTSEARTSTHRFMPSGSQDVLRPGGLRVLPGAYAQCRNAGVAYSRGYAHVHNLSCSVGALTSQQQLLRNLFV